eukprot:Rhum_TRINITY_DN6666_c0_g1::Rhum_TRINITY_DN6666_c0_g1_i1::g.20533::m.20533
MQNPSAPMPKMLPTRGVPSQLQSILDKYEITIAEANDLVLLADYEIVFVADDSGSMQLCSVPAAERKLGAAMPTRWDELCQTVSLVAEIACCFDSDGIDVHFLNRAPVRNVTSTSDIRFVQAFQSPPVGGTPLTETVRRLVQEYSKSEKPVLFMLATDGEPNGGPGPFKMLLQDVLSKRITNTKMNFQILACTEDDTQVEWLNDFDDATDGIDVVDDYYSERKEVLAAGKVRQFKRSDWAIKALLGPISSKYDKLDERVPNFRPLGSKHAARQARKEQGECCVMM